MICLLCVNSLLDVDEEGIVALHPFTEFLKHSLCVGADSEMRTQYLPDYWPMI